MDEILLAIGNYVEEQNCEYEYIDGNCDNCIIELNGKRILIKIQ